jgi:hypothetical protein
LLATGLRDSDSELEKSTDSHSGKQLKILIFKTSLCGFITSVDCFDLLFVSIDFFYIPE